MPELPTQEYIAANPPKPIKVDGLTIIPLHATQYFDVFKTGADTLALEVHSNYAYFPFGELKDRSKLNRGLLKGFDVEKRNLKTDIGIIEIKILTREQSRLIFSNNRTTPGEYYDLDKGKILDTDVELVNGVRVGMDVERFYKSFFSTFPSELLTKYKCFVLINGDVKHFYSFENKKLKRIEFSSWHFFQIE